MSKYRKFKLISGSKTLDLMGEEFFFYAPTGLGMQNNINYLEMGAYFSEYSRNISQMQPSGTFIFTPDSAYANYQDLMNFLLGADSLTLGYQPQTDGWYYARVNVVSVEKTELNSAGILEVPVIFDMLSPWYVDSELNYTSVPEGISDNVYPFTYPDEYIETGSDYIITVSPQAQMPCDWSIRVKGIATNPVIKVVNNNKIIGLIDLTGVYVDEGSELVFTTIPTQDLFATAGAYIYNAGVYTNITTSIVPNSNYPAFIQIPGGNETQFIMNTGDIYTTPEFFVRVRQYYRTV